MSTINTSFTFTNGVPTSLVAIVGNKHYEADSSHSNWKDILNAVKSGDAKAFVNAIDVKTALVNYTVGNVKIVGSEVYIYDKIRLHGVVVDRLFDFMKNGLPVEPIMKFIDKLFKNPSSRAVNELYRFLEHKNLPITSDGNFRAYKGLNSDYYSKTAGNLTLVSGKVREDGRIYNGVGQVIECLRNQVNDNKDETCSYGLHAGSLSYAKDFAGSDGKFVIVEINPTDVVSIPSDCNGEKLRTCRYVVVEEYIAPLDSVYINTAKTPEPVVEEYNDEVDDEYDGDDTGNDHDDYDDHDDYTTDDNGDDLCQCASCREDREIDYKEGHAYGRTDGYRGLNDVESAYQVILDLRGISHKQSFVDGYTNGHNEGVARYNENLAVYNASEPKNSPTSPKHPNYHNKRDAKGKFTKA